MDLFSLYKFAAIASAISGLTLPIAGWHKIVRHRALELIALSEFFILTKLCVILIFHVFHLSFSPLPLSFFFSLLGALGLSKINFSKTLQGPIMVALNVVFIALQHSLVRFFPVLSNQMEISHFGSLITTTESENFAVIIFLLLFLFIFMWKRKDLERTSLELCFFQEGRGHLLSELFFIIPLILCLHSFGLILTLGLALIPPLLLGDQFKGHKKMTLALSFVGVFCSFTGFCLSLSFESLPSAPTQVVMICFASFLIRSLLKFSKL